MTQVPLTKLYKTLVAADIITHIGRDKKPTKDLPNGIKNGTGNLTEPQQKNAKDAFEKLLEHILAAEGADLWDFPGYTGDTQGADAIAQEVVSYALAIDHDKAHLAQDKISRFRQGRETNEPQNDNQSDVDKQIKGEGGDSGSSFSEKDDVNLPDAPSPANTNQPLGSSRGESHHRNYHVTSKSGAFKMARENKSIIPDFLHHDKGVLEISGDPVGTCILIEIQSKRHLLGRAGRNDEPDYSSQFVVQRQYPDTQAYCVETVDRREVECAIDDWSAIENRWVYRPSEVANKPFLKSELGDLELYLACAYRPPKQRTAGKARVNPATRHIMVFSNVGLTLLTTSNFVQVVGEEKAKSYARECCKLYGIPAPDETLSKEVRVLDPDFHRAVAESRVPAIVQIPRQTRSTSAVGSNAPKDFDQQNDETMRRIQALEGKMSEVTEQVKAILRVLEKFALNNAN